jgi:hypothetical protein
MFVRQANTSFAKFRTVCSTEERKGKERKGKVTLVIVFARCAAGKKTL